MLEKATLFLHLICKKRNIYPSAFGQQIHCESLIGEFYITQTNRNMVSNATIEILLHHPMRYRKQNLLL